MFKPLTIIHHVVQQKATEFENNLCVIGASCITMLLTMDFSAYEMNIFSHFATGGGSHKFIVLF